MYVAKARYLGDDPFLRVNKSYIIRTPKVIGILSQEYEWAEVLAHLFPYKDFEVISGWVYVG